MNWGSMIAHSKDRDRQMTGRGSGVRAVTPKGVVYTFGGCMERKPGSLGGEMRMRVNEHCRTLSNHTRRNYIKACAAFDKWRKNAGLSNRAVRADPRAAVLQWRDALRAEGYAVSTLHTMVSGVCCGLKISSAQITPHGSAENKSKSLGRSARSRAAMEKPSNADIVQFQQMVGGRRGALGRLRGRDFGFDESAEPVVIFECDKGGKKQKQRIMASDVEKVKAYFDRVGPDELLFCRIDRDLDLHGVRAFHAAACYRMYAEKCACEAGRAEVRRQLWVRYTDPEIGCKAYLLAQAEGDKARARKQEYRFRREMRSGTYHLRGANRRVALQRGLPTEYDRTALLATSVFTLSHWRVDTAVKSYLLSENGNV